MSEIGICGLCANYAELRQSHVIPAFAFRWLKKRSATGFLRQAKNPNVRIQDGVKIALLCSECELRFSQFENKFNQLLLKSVARSDSDVAYDEWLLRFCVSLSWRVLVHCKGQNPDAHYTDEQERLCLQAAGRWKAFLLQEAPHPGQFCQHVLVFTEMVGSAPADMPKNMNRYLLGGIEMDIVGSDSSLMTFAKIGPVVVFGIVQPPEGDWMNTKVHVRSGKVRPGKFQAPGALGSFFYDRARMVDETHDKISDRQHRKVQDEYSAVILRDPDGFAKSHHGKAILADARMFGEEAILDRRK